MHIMRVIPLETMIIRETVNEDTGLTAEQELLEFCKEPRKIHEIKRFLELETINQTYWRFIKPLTTEGKLNFTMPDDPDNVKQMYITAGVEMTAQVQDLITQKLKTDANRELEKKVLEYCTQPRMLWEIAEHLGFNHSVSVKKRAVEPLLSEGKLILRYPEWRDYQKQQYMIPECSELQVTKDNILDYCKEPRNKQGIVAHFTGSIKFAKHFIKPLIESGELVYAKCVDLGKIITTIKLVDARFAPDLEMLKEEASRHKHRKPYKRHSKPRIFEKKEHHIEWEKKALEFCKTPRTQAEIIKHLGIPSYFLCRMRVIEPLLEQGKIRLMYLHNKLYQHQKYVATEAETNLPFSDESIIEYCHEPRSKEDVENYFGISQHLCYKHINKLVESGKLKYAKATRIGNEIIYKRIVASDAPQEPMTEMGIPTDEEIIEYCTEPRYCYDIIEEFRINDYTCRKLVNRLLKEGRLGYTPEVVKRHRKLVKPNIK